MNSQSAVQVAKIWQVDSKTLGIRWTDGQENQYDVVMLRRSCPCAMCIDEWTNQKKLKDQDVAETVRPTRVESVGRYAMSIKFNDGHATGIYTFELLRNLVKH